MDEPAFYPREQDSPTGRVIGVENKQENCFSNGYTRMLYAQSNDKSNNQYVQSTK